MSCQGPGPHYLRSTAGVIRSIAGICRSQQHDVRPKCSVTSKPSFTSPAHATAWPSRGQEIAQQLEVAGLSSMTTIRAISFSRQQQGESVCHAARGDELDLSAEQPGEAERSGRGRGPPPCRESRVALSRLNGLEQPFPVRGPDADPCVGDVEPDPAGLRRSCRNDSRTLPRSVYFTSVREPGEQDLSQSPGDP